MDMTLEIATETLPKKQQMSIFFDSRTRNAADTYSERFYGVSKSQLVHLAIEYYCSWYLRQLGLELPSGWKIQGDKPVDVSLVRESVSEINNGQYFTVQIRETSYEAVTNVAEHRQMTPRYVIKLAIAAYLTEYGFLTEAQA